MWQFDMIFMTMLKEFRLEVLYLLFACEICLHASSLSQRRETILFFNWLIFFTYKDKRASPSNCVPYVTVYTFLSLFQAKGHDRALIGKIPNKNINEMIFLLLCIQFHDTIP